MKKIQSVQSFDGIETDLISTKDFILGFKKHCQVDLMISKLIFGDETERKACLETLNFYN